MFGRAIITLGICPHSSCVLLFSTVLRGSLLLVKGQIPLDYPASEPRNELASWFASSSATC